MNAIAFENSQSAAVEDAVVDVLHGAPEPWAASKIQKALPKGMKKMPAEAVEQALEKLVEQGRAHRYAPYRTQKQAPRYWGRPHEEYARQVIAETVQKKPRTASDLEKTVQKPLADLSQQQRREVVRQLVAERKIYELPSLSGGKTVRYSVSPPDPADYLRAAMGRFLKQEEKVRKQLAPLGVSAAEVREAARRLLDAKPVNGRSTPAAAVAEPPSSETSLAAESPAPIAREEVATDEAEERRKLVVEKIRELSRDPRLGGFVSVPDLRAAVAANLPDKQQFDTVLLDLARRRVVDLYPHDYPGSLPAPERDRLVADGQGAYYNGVSLHGG